MPGTLLSVQLGHDSESNRHVPDHLLALQQWPTQERPAGQLAGVLRACISVSDTCAALGDHLCNRRPPCQACDADWRMARWNDQLLRACYRHGFHRAEWWVYFQMPAFPPGGPPGHAMLPPVVPRLEADARPPRQRPTTPPAPKARATNPITSLKRPAPRERPKQQPYLKLARPRALPSTEPDPESGSMRSWLTLVCRTSDMMMQQPPPGGMELAAAEPAPTLPRLIEPELQPSLNAPLRVLTDPSQGGTAAAATSSAATGSQETKQIANMAQPAVAEHRQQPPPPREHTKRTRARPLIATIWNGCLSTCLTCAPSSMTATSGLCMRP